MPIQLIRFLFANSLCSDAASSKHIESVKAIVKGLEARKDGMPSMTDGRTCSTLEESCSLT
jgi:hypothetical protein